MYWVLVTIAGCLACEPQPMATKNHLDWTSTDITDAAAQGWQLAVIWDAKYERLEYEVQALPPNKDEGARTFLAMRVKANEKLALKANGLIMNSKMGSLRPSKRKKANGS